MTTNEQAAPKRTRFDATAQISTETKSPLALATAQISLHVLSLQPGIASILLNLGKDILVSRKRLFEKERQVRKMEQDVELLPTSARIDFIPRVSKAMELSAEYITLKEEAETAKGVYQRQCKGFIIRALKIDIKALRATLQKELAKAFCVTAKAFLIADGFEIVNLQRLANTLLDRHHETLLTDLQSTLPEFRAIYIEANGLTVLPDPLMPADNLPHVKAAAVAAHTAALAAHRIALAAHDSLVIPPPAPPQPPPPDPPAPPDPAQRETIRVFRTLESVFILPWRIYNDSRVRNERTLALKKLSTEYLTETATEEAQMDLDLEVPADRQQLQELIRKQSDTANKKLTSQVKKLEKQLSSVQLTKNNPRGQQKKGGASITKRKSPSPTKKRGQSPEADASSNGSEKTKNGKGKKTGKNKPKRKRNKSGTPKNKPS